MIRFLLRDLGGGRCSPSHTIQSKVSVQKVLTSPKNRFIPNLSQNTTEMSTTQNKSVFKFYFPRTANVLKFKIHQIAWTLITRANQMNFTLCTLCESKNVSKLIQVLKFKLSKRGTKCLNNDLHNAKTLFELDFTASILESIRFRQTTPVNKSVSGTGILGKENGRLIFVTRDLSITNQAFEGRRIPAVDSLRRSDSRKYFRGL